MKTNLLIIDPQVDFCGGPDKALYVPGADEDCKRLADMIVRLKDDIDDIYVTLDSHNYVDIAHPIFWINEDYVNGSQHPDPYEIISVEDIESGKWTTTNPDWHDRALEYVKALAENKRYPLCIWPPHCLAGTNGQAIQPCVSDALIEWCKELAEVNFIYKGMNKFTEHYSALKADVYDRNDPTTGINEKLLKVMDADVVLVAGQALDYCVANTVRDIADHIDEPEIKKLVLLTDACSNVGAVEGLGENFVAHMRDRGMQVSTAQGYKI